MEPGLIKKILLAIDCTQNISLIDALWAKHDYPTRTAGSEEVLARRVSGDKRPMVVYGFDSLERVRQREGGSILESLGVFYLQLPAKLSEVRDVIQKATSFDMPSEGAIGDKIIRSYMIQKIRSFKHTCDNVWMSMSANANRAKKTQKAFPYKMPDPLSEFKSDRIERFLKTYKELEPMLIRLRIDSAERIRRMIDEVIGCMDQIEGKTVSPHMAVNLAFKCVEKIQAISNILGKAKELEKSG